MKKTCAKISLILFLIIGIIIVALKSSAYDDESSADGKFYGSKSVTGIFLRMRKSLCEYDPPGADKTPYSRWSWIESTPKSLKSIEGGYGDESGYKNTMNDCNLWLTSSVYSKDYPNIHNEKTLLTNNYTGGIISCVGAFCFGHQTQGTGNKVSVRTINMDYNSIERELKLAYMIGQSIEKREAGNNNTWKNRIRKWLYNHSSKYGINIQSKDGNTDKYTDVEKVTNYATKLKNREFGLKIVSKEKDAEGYLPIKIKADNNHKVSIFVKVNGNYKKVSYKYNGNSYDSGTKIGTGGQYKEVKIKIPDGDVTKIKIEQDVTYYKAKIVMTQPAGGKNQDICIFDGKKTSDTLNIEKSIDIIENDPYGLRIKKVDEDGKALSGAKFRIKKENGYYLYKQASGEIISTPDINRVDPEANSFVTNNKGIIDIESESLIGKNETFIVKEEIAPDGYEKDEEEHRVVSSDNYEDNPIVITNKKMLKLTGMVWEDRALNKNATRNDIYDGSSSITSGENDKITVQKNDNGDKELQKVTVRLIQGNDIKAETKTNSDGMYEFDLNALDIVRANLKDCYIEFEYNGLSYQTVTKAQNNNETNASKASETTRGEFNNKFKVISKDLAQGDGGNISLQYDFSDHKSKVNYGRDSIEGWTGSLYYSNSEGKAPFPISNVQGDFVIKARTDALSNFTIEDGMIEEVNMGVFEREQPDLDLIEDIQSTKTKIKGYEYTYEKNEKEGKENLNQKFDLSMSFGEKYGPNEYTGQIYASDIGYSEDQSNTDKLEVYVTNKIVLRNMSTNLYNRINEIVSYYDTRYDKITEIKEASGTKLIEGTDYKTEVSDKTGYKKLTIKKAQDVGESNKILYITYKLSDEAIKTLLSNDIELKSTMTEITSYSTFSNKEYTTYYAGVDKDSNPGSAELENKNTYEDDTDFAPAFKINLREREIKGTVWEDERNAVNGDQNEKLGDGKYNLSENTVKSVKVELYEITNGTTEKNASLYTYDKDKNIVSKEVNATAYTNEKGEYIFKGLIPGNYIIKYTYGNNEKTEIYSSTGNKINELNANKYKSTLYRGGAKSSIPEKWYADETSKNKSERLSDARDMDSIIEKRIKDEEIINYKRAIEIAEDNVGESVIAETENIPVSIEYDGNENTINEEGSRLTTVSFDQVDFGITQRPKQFIDISKTITNVEVVLANGQTIISGNPQTDTIKYLKKMPDGNIQIEIDKELIQGANLNIEYTITADPKGTETDYLTKDYYLYGSNKTKLRKIKIIKLLDYVSNDLVPNKDMILQNGETNNNKKWKKEEIKPEQMGVDFSEEAYKEIEKYNWILSTDEFKEINPKDGPKSVSYKASKILSTSEDMNFDNDVEVNQLQGTILQDSIPGNYIPPRYNTNEEDSDNSYITITPPTGENGLNIVQIISIGISLLVTLGVGIVFIKKKVL